MGIIVGHLSTALYNFFRHGLQQSGLHGLRLRRCGCSRRHDGLREKRFTDVRSDGAYLWWADGFRCLPNVAEQKQLLVVDGSFGLVGSSDGKALSVVWSNHAGWSCGRTLTSDVL